MRTMILCHRNEKKINKKFILLKVASDKKFGVNISRSTVPDCVPFPMDPLLFVYKKQIQIVLF
jgi:hypothetical protein